MSETQPPLPVGFRYAGVACGIKPSGKPDMALIVSDGPSVAAGVYTRNRVVAAPVVVCRSRTPSSGVRGVVINSGNANACTGAAGAADAVAMTAQVAQRVGCDEADVLIMSTGVIGQPLPMRRVSAGIDQAHRELGSGITAFHAAAEAIRTTDVDRKTAHRTCVTGRGEFSVAAMAKGAGMIAPDMATMLAVMITDAPLDQGSADRIIREVADSSFNRISVDGHTSTNDTLLLLSGGRGEPLEGPDLAGLADQLCDTGLELAKRIVADGEGAKHFFEVAVSGAASDADADRIAATVAASPLVKTAISGGDPNWGRIVSAAGYAAAEIDPEQMGLKILGVTLYEHGTPLAFDHQDLRRRMTQTREVSLELTVGGGPGRARRWASDLTTDYVTFNAEYTT